MASDHSHQLRSGSGGVGGARFVAGLVAACVASLAILWALLAEGAGPLDDDYIVYRYARNWIGHGVLAFNLVGPGSDPATSEGYTSPLWLLLCAGSEWMGLAPERFTSAVGGLSALLMVVFTGLAARAARPDAGTNLPLVAAALIAVSPAVSWHALAGLGTAPMGAGIAIGAFGAAAGRWRTFGVAMSVAACFRLEAIVVALPLVFWMRGGEGRRSPSAFLPLLAVGLVLGGRWLFLGRWLPATYHVKALPLDVELGYGAAYLVRTAGEGGLSVLGLAAVIGLGGKGASRAFAVASAGALVFVLLCGGDWVVYGRFLVPFAPVLVLGAVLLVPTLKLPAARWAALALLLAITLGGHRSAVRAQALFERAFFESWWQEVGETLAKEAPSDATVALSPIGAVGYYSERTIIDVLGLTHSAFLERDPDLEGVAVKGHHRHDGAWVLDQEPTYLLLGNATLQPESGGLDVNPWEVDITTDPRFRRDYEAETAWVGRPDGSRRAIPYFRRRSAPRLSGD